MTTNHQQHTVILVADDAVSRIDFDCGHSLEIVRSSTANRPDSLELGDAVRAALSLGPYCDGKIWVLTDELWSGYVSLENQVATAIEPDRLDQTLALEAEYESGISPFDSRLCAVPIDPVDGKPTWWVTQTEMAQWHAVRAAIQSADGELAGLTTIPELSSNEEFPANGEFLSDEVRDRLVDSLAAQWLDVHLSSDISIPVISCSPSTGTQKQRIPASVLVPALILISCFALNLYGERQLIKGNADVARLDQRETELIRDAATKSLRLSKIKQQQDATRYSENQRRLQFRRAQAEYAARRNRPTEVLRALAATVHPGHWIRSIDLNEEQVVLSGLAIDHDSVSSFAQHIESELDRVAWFVHPAKMSIDLATHLVHFELTLVPIESFDPHLTALVNRGNDVH